MAVHVAAGLDEGNREQGTVGGIRIQVHRILNMRRDLRLVLT